VPVAAQPQPEPAAPVAVQPKAEPEAPAVLPVKVALAAEAPTAEKPVPAAAPVATGAADARARCKEIASSRRQKDLVSVCSDAFAADPTADVAVILAKAEFDKGRSAQALAWSQKALAADPNAAEAYVFLGGAEQNAGHNKAAKEAYKHYLQLAPSGRYASDLRVIVGSL
jgi:Flp pilus assembly protein TadD